VFHFHEDIYDQGQYTHYVCDGICTCIRGHNHDFSQYILGVLCTKRRIFYCTRKLSVKNGGKI
jgi:hypothetical protein